MRKLREKDTYEKKNDNGSNSHGTAASMAVRTIFFICN